jgi:hypothetical protein
VCSFQSDAQTLADRTDRLARRRVPERGLGATSGRLVGTAQSAGAERHRAERWKSERVDGWSDEPSGNGQGGRVRYLARMLFENEVVDAVAAFIRHHGWVIESMAHAHQRGDDIAATKGDWRLLVEAKGASSSKPGTSRYGRAFTSNQVGSHVGVAVLRALRWASIEGVRPALAFPDNPHHRAHVDPIATSLTTLGVAVFWVSEATHDVLPQAPWPV